MFICKFQFGITPVWGTSHLLFKILGRPRAIELLSSGNVLNANEARTIGLANFVFKDNAEYDAWIQHFLSIEPDVLRAVKRISTDSEHSPINDASDAERKVFVETWGGDAHFKALNSGKKHR